MRGKIEPGHPGETKGRENDNDAYVFDDRPTNYLDLPRWPPDRYVYLETRAPFNDLVDGTSARRESNNEIVRQRSEDVFSKRHPSVHEATEGTQRLVNRKGAPTNYPCVKLIPEEAKAAWGFRPQPHATAARSTTDPQWGNRPINEQPFISRTLSSNGYVEVKLAYVALGGTHLTPYTYSASFFSSSFACSPVAIYLSTIASQKPPSPDLPISPRIP